VISDLFKSWSPLEKEVFEKMMPHLEQIADIDVEITFDRFPRGKPGWVNVYDEGRVISKMGDKYVIQVREDTTFFMLIHEYAHIALWFHDANPIPTRVTELDVLVLQHFWFKHLAPEHIKLLFKEARTFYVGVYENSKGRKNFQPASQPPVEEFHFGMMRSNAWAHEVDKLQHMGCLDTEERPTYRQANWDALRGFNEYDCHNAVKKRKSHLASLSLRG
jgi:hypothetical protein